MPAPKEILDLIARFDQHIDDYRNGKYNETQLRRDYLDPFLKALGWDVDNAQGHAEAYREVVHEDQVKIGGNTKSPDYSCRVGGTRKFFVEAKKPSVYIKDEPAPAFQLRRYAWSAKLPLSILTDFEEFAVYDCRVRPNQNDKAATARVHYWTYRDYADKWDEIAAIFSKEAVLKGSFDKYAATTKGKKGTTEVDAAFLDEIEGWREALAKDIARNNGEISQHALNWSVQQTIDRIIFLRIAEDRGIEPEQLRALQNGANVYARLKELFHKADDRYNSGLFHFKKEPDRLEEPDRLTPGLVIEDKTLKDIFKHLYYPDSPYEFSVLGADILGSVYEQFLGKVIRLTEGHHAKIEEKPEVKKAGGVFYTPTYIVQYIVQHTVGKLLEDKTPKEAEKLRILDPACGSGSFLIDAYQYLLDWHRDWYVSNGAEKHAKGRSPQLHQGRGGTWRLTTAERKRILVNNLYGVDIDSQAVEVTKLSLLLKVLEGETQLEMFHERVLPDLGSNIKCGNSLIDTEFYHSQLIPLDDADRSRINAFDWHEEFPDVFKPSPSGGGQGEGGFDAVIGNPPYIRIQVMKEWAPQEVEYYKTQYLAASKGNYDIYVVFVEKGLSLLNKTGRLGFILPHKFFNAQYGEPLRLLISQGKHLAEVVHFGHEQVFDGATTYACLMFLDKTQSKQVEFVKVDDLGEWRRSGAADRSVLPVSAVKSGDWAFTAGKGTALLDRLSKLTLKLEDVTDRIFQGIKTSADKIYIVEERERKKGRVLVYSPERDTDFWLEPALLHPLVKGGDSKAYSLTQTERLILFPYAPQGDGATKLITENVFKSRYPLTWEYLKVNKAYLEDREKGKMRGPKWYGYVYPKALDVMPLPKIFTPDIAPRAAFSLDPTGKAFFTGGAAGGYGILVRPEYSREYVLGLLNSRLLDWQIKQTATQFRGGWYSFEARFIRSLPIIVAEDRARHDRMVSLVETMLALHKQLAAASTPHEQESLKRQIDVTDRQINKLVYELYGLTDEEISVVEGSV